MSKHNLLLIVVTGFFVIYLCNPGVSTAQQESIASQHVRMLVPSERGSLGREVIGELERFYEYANRATGSSLPAKILIIVSWDREDSSCRWRDASITVGMNQPAAAANLNAFLFHSAAREIARLGLLSLSDGAQREDTEFLFEGMIEILVHEFDQSSRKLEATWAISKFLDQMNMLGLPTQRSWSSFSGGSRCLRTASPGVTFLSTFRELQGRDRPLKLFEALRKNSLTASLSEAFRAHSSEIETTWINSVRNYPPVDEITTAPEDVPKLEKIVLFPLNGKQGSSLQVRLFIGDRARNLLPCGVFIRDERTGKLMQPLASSENGLSFLKASISIDSNCAPGQYDFQITAIDESGNLRQWVSHYVVSAR